jgi:hypothetical protein
LSVSFHNPDQYMASLRTIIAQGRKRVGLLVGAGAPAGMACADGTRPLIPAVAGLTERVLTEIDPKYGAQIAALKADLAKHDIETLLSRIRSLGGVIGTTKVHDLDGNGYRAMAEAICVEIGQIVRVRLPAGATAYGELVSWITGAPRTHAVEIFTTNYDLLFEERSSGCVPPISMDSSVRAKPSSIPRRFPVINCQRAGHAYGRFTGRSAGKQANKAR